MELRTTQPDELEAASHKDRVYPRAEVESATRAVHATSTRDIEDLLRRLKSRYVGERMAAEGQLSALGPEEVSLLISIAKREQVRFGQRRKVYFGLAAAFAAICVPASLYCLYECIALSLAHNPAAGAWGGAIGGILGGGGGGILGGFSWLPAPTPLQISAAEALAKVQDKRAIGPLAQAIEMSAFYELRYGAARALTILLPTLTEADADLLDGAQRQSLRAALVRCHRDKESEFAIAIMEALAQIGDTRAIEAIQQVGAQTQLPSHLYSANERRVEACARKVLAALLELRDRQHIDGTLLRPSQDTAREPDILLRAAQASSATAADELLTPSDPPTKESSPNF